MSTPVWIWKLLMVAAVGTLALGGWMLADSLQTPPPAPTGSSVPEFDGNFAVEPGDDQRRDPNMFAGLWSGDYNRRVDAPAVENETDETTIDPGPRYRSTDEAGAILTREVEVAMIAYTSDAATDRSLVFLRLGNASEHVSHGEGDRFQTPSLTGVVNRVHPTTIDVTFVLADQPGYPYYAQLSASGAVPIVTAPLDQNATTHAPDGLGTDVEVETPRAVARSERDRLAASIEAEFAAVRCHASFDPIAGTFEGVILDEVPEDSAAARHGFARGDRVIAVNDELVRSVADLRRAVEACVDDPEIEVTFVRDGRTVMRRYVIDAE